MSKEMFQKGAGNDGVQFSTEKMREKFMEADKKIKAAQEKSSEKGPLQVSLGDKPLNMIGVVRIEGQSEITVRGPAPVSAAST